MEQKKLKRSTTLNGLFREKRCANCGKRFVRIDFEDYAYVLNNKYYCSYTCFRAAERIYLNQKQIKRRYSRVD